MGWPRFHGFSMIAKDLVPIPGIRCFAIMKRLLKSHDWKSHPPPPSRPLPGPGPRRRRGNRSDVTVHR